MQRDEAKTPEHIDIELEPLDVKNFAAMAALIARVREGTLERGVYVMLRHHSGLAPGDCSEDDRLRPIVEAALRDAEEAVYGGRVRTAEDLCRVTRLAALERLLAPQSGG